MTGKYISLPDHLHNAFLDAVNDKNLNEIVAFKANLIGELTSLANEKVNTFLNKPKTKIAVSDSVKNKKVTTLFGELSHKDRSELDNYGFMIASPSSIAIENLVNRDGDTIDMVIDKNRRGHYVLSISQYLKYDETVGFLTGLTNIKNFLRAFGFRDFIKNLEPGFDFATDFTEHGFTDDVNKTPVKNSIPSITKKSKIFDYIQENYGETFTRKEALIAVLMVTGWIKEPSEYSWKIHRGVYACAFSAYQTNYFYIPGRDGRYLTKVKRGVYSLSGTKFSI